MQYSDVQAYGTGVLYTYLIGYTMTLRECAEFLIKKSDNTAWKMLDRYLGRDYIRAEFRRRCPTAPTHPQPLPERTRVSHKVGYYGSTFAHAGAIFPEGATQRTPTL